MGVSILVFAAALAGAQPPDAAYEPLARAYEALRTRDYDTAIPAFLKAVEAAPQRASIRNDLAFAYLKTGENERAREQFEEALRLTPEDTQLALDYAFLCYETKHQVEARRIFDRLRQTAEVPFRATAEQAFRNIDAPLAAGIERWRTAIASGADNFSAHFELATLAEQRDELELAADHYERAWRILPDRRSVLVALGRVWTQLHRQDDANAALLAASRGGEPRAAEMARELLPDRYPFVPEFRAALHFDPANIELRRELGFLLLRMERPLEAEQEFRIVTDTAPGDLLAATQLGFLLYARGDQASAQPLFDRVLAGNDEDLANRVRAVLRLPQVLTPRPDVPPASVDAMLMADRSIQAGFIKDAVKYLRIAHEGEPGDFRIMFKLGWAYNILHQDVDAGRWFELARHSPDLKIATEASRAWRNLRSGASRFRTTAWLYPVFSTRWHDLFSYGQVKTDMRTGLPIRPYVSMRFVGDTRQTIGAAAPQYLSESSFILGIGIATTPWHGIMGWAEAGSAMSYLTGHMLPDYRGGLSMTRNFGATLDGEYSGWFVGSSTDAVFLSRFNNDFLFYQQTRLGYAIGPGLLRAQLHWNVNLTADSKRQRWANFIEVGPGIRFRLSFLPPSMFVSFDTLSGGYLIHESGNRPNFRDFRAGLWYAFTH
ncbi:MAG TPA: tetratricopeptide repeat protein [Bryobacteraceae bacterium]|nr:tetratricopeptide repeat protein [Bryobacteraceae bacterium]